LIERFESRKIKPLKRGQLFLSKKHCNKTIAFRQWIKYTMFLYEMLPETMHFSVWFV